MRLEYWDASVMESAEPRFKFIERISSMMFSYRYSFGKWGSESNELVCLLIV
jgi:hypothetical protein